MIELLQYSFFVNALISSILVGILGGFIGTYIVTRRLVFIAGGLAHASLGGVGLCALCSAPPILGASIFSLLSAAGVKRISQTLAIKDTTLWIIVKVQCNRVKTSLVVNVLQGIPSDRNKLTLVVGCT